MRPPQIRPPWTLSLNRSAELQFGTVCCVRRAAIVPNRSSALHSHGSWSQCMRKNERRLSMHRPMPGPSQEGKGAGASDRWLSSWGGAELGSGSVNRCEWTSRSPGIRRMAVIFGLALLLLFGLNARAFVTQVNTNGDTLRWHLDPLEPTVPPNP